MKAKTADQSNADDVRYVPVRITESSGYLPDGTYVYSGTIDVVPVKPDKAKASKPRRRQKPK